MQPITIHSTCSYAIVYNINIHLVRKKKKRTKCESSGTVKKGALHNEGPSPSSYVISSVGGVVLDVAARRIVPISYSRSTGDELDFVKLSRKSHISCGAKMDNNKTYPVLFCTPESNDLPRMPTPIVVIPDQNRLVDLHRPISRSTAGPRSQKRERHSP